MSSFDEFSKMFEAESAKLDNLISTVTSKPDLSINEIVETYYQIMNVSSMTTMLKQQFKETEHDSLFEKITNVEKIIHEKFNTKIHPQIMGRLSNSIQETTKNLQSGEKIQKSKEDIENEAKLYEELRQQMSTKEFVEQYDKELK